MFLNNDGKIIEEKKPKSYDWPIFDVLVYRETNAGRLLKVVYIKYPDFYQLKSAYNANKKWIKAFNDVVYWIEYRQL